MLKQTLRQHLVKNERKVMTTMAETIEGGEGRDVDVEFY
jgi:hypothetical protein